MTAGLPAGRKLIIDHSRPQGCDEREQGDQRSFRARAYGLRYLPADTGKSTHPERTA